MNRVFGDRGVQIGLACSSIFLTATLLGYCALYAFATRVVLNLDLRRTEPLTGVDYYGVESGFNGSLHPVLLRRVLDIHNVASSVAESHHSDRASAEEFSASCLPDLIVASEDRRFYRHSGVDFIALVPRLLRGKGASTLTMQLARTTSLQTLAFPLFRKPYEWALAAALEQNLNKDLILLHYANSIYVGKAQNSLGFAINMDGVKTAAYHLFAKNDLRTVSLAEGATIVALFTSPNSLLGAWSAGNPQPLLRVRNEVLRRVVESKPIQYAARVADASGEPIRFRTAVDDGYHRYPSEAYFFNTLSRFQGATKFARNSHIQTTLDPVLQRFAAEALQKVLAAESSASNLDLNGALIALDPRTGEVRALVGGVDRAKSELNRAHAKYSPGSTVKPFLYADAFDHGIRSGIPFTPAYRMNLEEGSMNGWTPADHVGGVIGPRTALSASSNRGALLVGNIIGMERGCEVERRAFNASHDCSPQILLGGGMNNQITPLALAEAYAAFANGGDRVEAQLIAGRPVNRQHLFSAEAAFVTTQLLRSVIGDRPDVQATMADGKRLAGLPASAELAAKTGSTDTTVWIAVIHPRLVVVVAAATDDNRKTDGLFGGAVAGAVWARFVHDSLASRPWYFDGHFERPQGVEQHNFDPGLGCLDARGTAREYFLANRLPKRCN